MLKILDSRLMAPEAQLLFRVQLKPREEISTWGLYLSLSTRDHVLGMTMAHQKDDWEQINTVGATFPSQL